MALILNNTEKAFFACKLNCSGSCIRYFNEFLAYGDKYTKHSIYNVAVASRSFSIEKKIYICILLLSLHSLPFDNIHTSLASRFLTNWLNDFSVILSRSIFSLMK